MNEKINRDLIRYWLIVILLGAYIYLRGTFLTTLSGWWIAGFYIIIAILIGVFLYTTKKTVNVVKVLKLSALTALVGVNLVYLYAVSRVNHTKPFKVEVTLNGYHIRRVDDVLFSYKGYNFEKTLNLTDAISKYGDDLSDKCNLKLSLKQALPNFYYEVV